MELPGSPCAGMRQFDGRQHVWLEVVRSVARHGARDRSRIEPLNVAETNCAELRRDLAVHAEVEGDTSSSSVEQRSDPTPTPREELILTPFTHGVATLSKCMLATW